LRRSVCFLYVAGGQWHDDLPSPELQHQAGLDAACRSVYRSGCASKVVLHRIEQK